MKPLLAALLLCASVQDPDPKGPRPIAARETLWTEEMTWMEIRDALAAGRDTILIATGGIEQNGPYLATGKHDVILRATAPAIARKLGNTLLAPIVPFVPEDDHMKYPGTISLRQETFRALLTDLCSSYHAHGFKTLVLIGDSGGNQEGLEQVARELSAKWADAKVVYVPEYYHDTGEQDLILKAGLKEGDEGLHDGFAITAQMMTVDPDSVRMKERIAAGKFRINGVELAPAERTIELGRKIVELRADVTVAAIRKALGR